MATNNGLRGKTHVKKKTLQLLTILALSFTLAACGQEASVENNTSKDTEVNTEAGTAGAEMKQKSRQKIAKSRKKPVKACTEAS